LTPSEIFIAGHPSTFVAVHATDTFSKKTTLRTRTDENKWPALWPLISRGVKCADVCEYTSVALSKKLNRIRAVRFQTSSPTSSTLTVIPRRAAIDELILAARQIIHRRAELAAVANCRSPRAAILRPLTQKPLWKDADDLAALRLFFYSNSNGMSFAPRAADDTERPLVNRTAGYRQNSHGVPSLRYVNCVSPQDFPHRAQLLIHASRFKIARARSVEFHKFPASSAIVELVVRLCVQYCSAPGRNVRCDTDLGSLQVRRGWPLSILAQLT